jgi:hypothetical protein
MKFSMKFSKMVNQLLRKKYVTLFMLFVCIMVVYLIFKGFSMYEQFESSEIEELFDNEHNKSHMRMLNRKTLSDTISDKISDKMTGRGPAKPTIKSLSALRSNVESVPKIPSKFNLNRREILTRPPVIQTVAIPTVDIPRIPKTPKPKLNLKRFKRFKRF